MTTRTRRIPRRSSRRRDASILLYSERCLLRATLTVEQQVRRSPCLRELREALGVSNSHVAFLRDNLTYKGYLTYQAGQRHSIALTDAGRRLAEHEMARYAQRVGRQQEQQHQQQEEAHT